MKNKIEKITLNKKIIFKNSTESNIDIWVTYILFDVLTWEFIAVTLQYRKSYVMWMTYSSTSVQDYIQELFCYFYKVKKNYKPGESNDTQFDSLRTGMTHFV